MATAGRSADAAPIYSLLDLGPTADSVTLTGLNALGQVTYHTNFGGVTSAFRTEPNSPFNLDSDALGTLGGFSAVALGLNGRGQVAGASDTFSGATRAFRTGPQQSIDPADNLGTFGGPSSIASAINDRGQVVGHSTTASGATHAFRTTANLPINPATDDLGTLGGSSKSIAINNRGQVIGESQPADGGPVRGFRTMPDAPINPATDDLGSLGGANTFARSVNRSGQVVGFSNLAGNSGVLRAFRTRPDAAIDPLTDDLGALGGASSFAAAINDRGEVVGESDRAAGSSHAFITLRTGGMLDLNGLLDDNAAGWELFSARAINNHGQILVVARLDPDGNGPEPVAGRAALLTPARQILTAEWKSSAGGPWGESVYWQGGVPDATGHRARFTGSPAASPLIDLGGDRVLGHLEFAPEQPGAGGYVLSGASVTFRNGLELATLSAAGGQHRIAAPVILSDHVRVDVSAGAGIAFEQPLAVPATMILTKTGAGALYFQETLTVEPLAQVRLDDGTLQADAVESEGAVVVSAGSVLAAGRIAAASMSIAGAGRVRLLPGAVAASRIRFLNIAGEIGAWAGSFDLGPGVLVLQATPGDRANRLALTHDQVRHARNSGGIPWSGAGITSELAALDTAGLTAVGVLLNDDGNGNPIYDAFGGQALDTNSILVRATAAGDLDLNGVLDIADYFRIDHGDRLNLAGYSNGDIDYSGSIGPDDYSLMDRAFLFRQQQGAAMSPSSPAAVPEPTSFVFLTAAASLQFRQRRRRIAPARACRLSLPLRQRAPGVPV